VAAFSTHVHQTVICDLEIIRPFSSRISSRIIDISIAWFCSNRRIAIISGLLDTASCTAERISSFLIAPIARPSSDCWLLEEEGGGGGAIVAAVDTALRLGLF
jgi:hypothetical protein